ncbi:carbohydrate kinase [Desulfonema ishimotonii]|uniref:Carbohydrate kinase n=1 Tax=Desulfonema ishimotonii TaxID=45657 RepID=A0A401FV07_9BACT|nr:carbohydrate kinase [Desulfonema ishimotonii]GBC60799.1 carbohydrate kinase [Desulfonema ishimotonii]
MILTIGEILIDIFPDDSRIGGAPFNFAAHLRALGFPVIFISRIGNDDNGDMLSDAVKKRGFDLKYIQRDDRHATGHVRVTLDEDGLPEFDIVRDVAYDHLDYTAPVAEALLEVPRLIYYGTLVQRTAKGAATLMKILEHRSPATRCFYDINLRPGGYDKNAITKSLIHCDVLKLNDDELAILRHFFDFRTPDNEFIEDLMHSFSVEWVCLTGGERGSTLFTREGLWHADAETTGEIADTVGAGDAFAAVLAAGYLEGWKPEQIVRRAARLAGAVCGIRGAIPEEDMFYDRFSGWR